jgi:hypothetical protein
VLYGPGKHEMGLTCGKAGPCCFEVPLIFLNLECKMGDVIVNLPIPRDLSCQASIVSVGHGGLENVKVTARAGEHVPEPCG